MSSRWPAMAVAFSLPWLAVPAFADCVSDVRAVMANLTQAGPQRIVSTVTTKAGLVALVSERVAGALHASSYGQGAVTEYTVVGDRAWSRADGGDWSELPAATAADMAAAAGLDGVESFDDILDAQCLGTDAGSFQTLYRLTYRRSGVAVLAEVETSPNSGLPRRIRSRSTVDGDKVFVVSEFTYDPAITVTAPF